MGIDSQDWPSFLSEIEKHVVEGQHENAKGIIQKLNFRKIPRAHAAGLAELAWRISQPLWTLKILDRILFPENELTKDATDREKLIYATALGNLGAVNEAIQIFDSINSQREPEVLLRKALAHFRQWDYPKAIPHLEQFLKTDGLAPYRKLIGKVNLAAALIADFRFADAQTWLDEIQTECRENQYRLLLGNYFELQGQVFFFQNEHQKALSCFEESIRLLENQGGEFSLYSEKWKAISQAFLKNDARSLSEIRKIKLKALSMGQWETSRDCDLFEAVLTEDQELAEKVILGTPFSFYRERVRRLTKDGVARRTQFNWLLGSLQSSAQIFVFDPYEMQRGKKSLHGNPQLLALFEALTVDFYRPSHIGLLFQRIYRNEKFNPFNSPQRVLRLIKRLDLWFQDQGVPLQVSMKKSEFSILGRDESPVQIRVRRKQGLSKKEGQNFHLQQFFKDRTFTVKDVSRHMNLSRATAQNVLKKACEEGLVLRSGAGRATNYVLSSRTRKKAAA